MAQRQPAAYPEQHPRCFLHMPKCGGISVHDALVAALPEGSVSADRGDAATSVCGELEEGGRAARRAALCHAGKLRAEYEIETSPRTMVVSGHFYLSTLLTVASLESIATVLREPRARILSLYAFWRLTPGYESWYPYTPHDHAMRPLDGFLSEPVMAPAVDNVMCRILLYRRGGHDLIPGVDFISSDHVESVATDAIDQLDRLGFVGVIERANTTWEGLSRFFGVTLEPTRANVTASSAILPDVLPIQGPITDRTLNLLHARTAADVLVYRHALTAEVGESEAELISDTAFARQLVRLGSVAGDSAAAAQSLTSRVRVTESQLAALAEQLSSRETELDAQRALVIRLTEELGRHQAEVARHQAELARHQAELAGHQAELARYRAWLEGIQGSLSWRMTSPLRVAKRQVLSQRGRW